MTIIIYYRILSKNMRILRIIHRNGKEEKLNPKIVFDRLKSEKFAVFWVWKVLCFRISFSMVSFFKFYVSIFHLSSFHFFVQDEIIKKIFS